MSAPINTALCSYGMSGKIFHAPFIALNPGYNLLGSWERTKELIGADYPGTISYKTFEELLADAAVELVIINTPNYTHYELAKQALQAGKHIVVEKPFTSTADEAAELIRLAKEKNKLISVYQNRRFDSDYKTVKQVLDEKLLGDVVEVEIHFDRFSESLSYKAHKETPGPGANIMYDLGSHLIDQALQLFGWPAAVFADTRVVRPYSKVDDYFDLLLYYPSVRVRLKSTYVAREAPVGYILHGLKGSFIKPKTNVQEVDLAAGKLPTAEGWGVEPANERGLLHTERDGIVIRELIPSLTGNYMNYYDQLHDAIRNGKPVPVTAEDGMKVIRIIEAAYQSSNAKKLIEL